ncbi:TetR/AcrR family transcriptional regulator C-terminal domain-containing protein [Paenibacillus favisporus]|uniref:TetR/AcrR family transcriptional regulator C-terminal domain-containing protein n=1 Tax=Paenibacillus favisporus TaxID=221028 RepID=UPI003390AE28
MVKRILSAFQDNGDWSEQLFRLGVNFRKQLQPFPCSAQLLMQTMPTATDYVSLLERMLSIIKRYLLVIRINSPHINAKKSAKFADFYALGSAQTRFSFQQQNGFRLLYSLSVIFSSV